MGIAGFLRGKEMGDWGDGGLSPLPCLRQAVYILTVQGLFLILRLLIGGPINMLRTFFKKIFPWLMAVLIFAYLFHQYPPRNIYNALKHINILAFFGVAIAYVALMFLLDTFSISRVLALFGHKETVRELLPARGITYLIMIVNYAAGQAAFAFYQYRKHGVPISKMLGIFGIIVIVDLFLLVTLAFITSFFTTWPFDVAGTNIGSFVKIFAISIYAGFTAIVLIMNRCSEISLVRRLRKNSLIDLITTTKIISYLKVAIVRLPIHIFIMGGMYVAVSAFGIYIPFLKILANIPIVFFIGSLPITPGGLGTSNAALVELFKPFVSAPAISSGATSAGDLLFSFSLVWLFANYIMKALIGITCIRFISRDLFRPVSKVSEEKAEDIAVSLGGNM